MSPVALSRRKLKIDNFFFRDSRSVLRRLSTIQRTDSPGERIPPDQRNPILLARSRMSRRIYLRPTHPGFPQIALLYSFCNTIINVVVSYRLRAERASFDQLRKFRRAVRIAPRPLTRPRLESTTDSNVNICKSIPIQRTTQKLPQNSLRQSLLLDLFTNPSKPHSTDCQRRHSPQENSDDQRPPHRRIIRSQRHSRPIYSYIPLSISSPRDSSDRSSVFRMREKSSVSPAKDPNESVDIGMSKARKDGAHRRCEWRHAAGRRCAERFLRIGEGDGRNRSDGWR